MKLPAYPRYKPSGVAWLGDVPEHWEVKRAKWSVAGCINGVWGDEPNGVDDVACVRVADFDRVNCLVTGEPPTLRAIEPGQLTSRQLRKGDLLIEKSGGGEKQLVGCVVYFNHDFRAVCSNFVARMPVIRDLYPRFWCYVHAALYAGKLNYPAIKQTTGIQNLDSSAYLDTPAPFPHVLEQQAIAAFLDLETGRIDRLLAKKRELIERLKEKRTALISRTVSHGLPPAAGLPEYPSLKPSGVDWIGDIPKRWTLKRVGDEFEFISYGFTNPMPTTNEGPRMVTANDVNDGKVLLETARCTDQADFEKLTCKSRPKRRDILVTKDGTLGRVGIVETDTPFCINQSVALLRPKSTANERFISLALQAPPYFDRMMFDGGGTTIKHIYITRLARMPFGAPPPDEQVAIAAYLDAETAKLDALAAKVEEAIERLQEFRAALITAAVTGKIQVSR